MDENIPVLFFPNPFFTRMDFLEGYVTGRFKYLATMNAFKFITFLLIMTGPLAYDLEKLKDFEKQKYSLKVISYSMNIVTKAVDKRRFRNTDEDTYSDIVLRSIDLIREDIKLRKLPRMEIVSSEEMTKEQWDVRDSITSEIAKCMFSHYDSPYACRFAEHLTIIFENTKIVEY